MGHPVTIGGRPVELAWTQDLAKRVAFRASKIGGGPTEADLRNRRKSVFAVTTLVWLYLPPGVHESYPTPEDLHVAIDHETEHEAITAALSALFADMTVDDEKKSTSRKSPSRASKSA